MPTELRIRTGTEGDFANCTLSPSDDWTAAMMRTAVAGRLAEPLMRTAGTSQSAMGLPSGNRLWCNREIIPSSMLPASSALCSRARADKLALPVSAQRVFIIHDLDELSVTVFLAGILDHVELDA